MKLSAWYLVPIFGIIYALFDRRRYSDEGIWMMMTLLTTVVNIGCCDNLFKFLLNLLYKYPI